jgi:transposase
MGIGKLRPFLPPCAMTVSTRPVCSTVQSTANASAPIIEQFLAPTLKPGDVVILDNLGSHQGKVVRQAVRAARARLVFLPKYSPDLNPIEQVFAKFKTLLRKAGARTHDAVADPSAAILAQYPPEECAAYLRNAGDA